jgi:hypothetical protein
MSSDSVHNNPDQQQSLLASASRRSFLTKSGVALTGIAAASTFGSSFALPTDALAAESQIEDAAEVLDSAAIGPMTPKKRVKRAFDLRQMAARITRRVDPPMATVNGDEEKFANKIANYSKALPHNNLGEPDLNAYNALIKALSSNQTNDFEAIPLGGTLRFENPQGGQVFELQGLDPSQIILPPPPRFESAEEAGEMVELYWMALTRDVPFSRYDTDPMIAAAADDLSRLSDFRGPKTNGRVTAANIFRGNNVGALNGPYISQLLLKPFQYGAFVFEQRFRIGMAGVDHMTKYEDWLSVQNGRVVTRDVFDPTPRFAFNGRALSEIVHNDPLYQLIYHAGVSLLGMRAARDPGNPYVRRRTTQGFLTFGGPFIFGLLASVMPRALAAVWYNKWYVHRRLRPEEFGGRVHNMLTNAARYPIHPDVLNSTAVTATNRQFGSFLLPQAFPEGSPTHPAYGAGHAAFAAAGVTMLKAFFDESFVISDPVMPNADGTALVPYVGPPLTVGGELDKLIANIGIGRNTAGVHWRTDANTLVGEEVAIGVMQELTQTKPFAEEFSGFALTKFDGTRITI